MQSNENDKNRIRILILEDDDNNIASIKAGILPNVKKSTTTDIAHKIALADQVFYIKRTYSIKEYFDEKKKDSFDISIVDIHLGNQKAIRIFGKTLKDGTDLYRFLKEEDKSNLVLLHSGKSNDNDIWGKLSPIERSDFIPRSLDGKNLSDRMTEEIENIILRILENTPDKEKEAIQNAMRDNGFNLTQNTLYSFGKRKLKLGDLIIHLTHPTLIKKGNKKMPVLKFPDGLNCIAETFKLLRKKPILGGKNNSSAIKRTPHIIDAYKSYTGIERSKFERENVVPKIIEILTIFSHETVPDFKIALPNTACTGYRLRYPQYENTTIARNDSFRENFLNHLVVRRSLLFIEAFLREYIDTGTMQMKVSHELIFKKYISTLLSGLQGKSRDQFKPNGIGLLKMELDLDLVIINTNRGDRERINSEKRIIHDFELEWLNGTQCLHLKREMVNKILLPKF